MTGRCQAALAEALDEIRESASPEPEIEPPECLQPLGEILPPLAFPLPSPRPASPHPPLRFPTLGQATSAARPPTTLRERRSARRQDIDSSAFLIMVSSGSRLAGRILDLSLSGCRIRTADRFPLGIYARIEAEFHAEGLPFRLGGVVQAIHDRCHVGIRFLDMSPRKREQLEQLIAELASEECRPGTEHASD